MDTRPGLLGVPYCCARRSLAMPLRASDCVRFLRELPSEADLHIDPPPVFLTLGFMGAQCTRSTGVTCTLRNTWPNLLLLPFSQRILEHPMESTPAMRLSADMSIADNSPAHVLGTCH